VAWQGAAKKMSRVLIFPFFLLLHPCVQLPCMGIHWERTTHAVACLPTNRPHSFPDLPAVLSFFGFHATMRCHKNELSA